MTRFIIIMAIFVSQSAFAGRCLVNEVDNRVVCCDAGEQALYYQLGNRVVCVESDSLESCLYHPIGNYLVCCEANQEALWYEIGSRVICCDQDADRGACTNYFGT